MPAYCRKGRWRYRKWIVRPDGVRQRISGTPSINTKKAAEHEERAHITRVLNPSSAPVPTLPAKEVPTVREYSKTFMAGYAADDKPSELASKRQILDAYILDWFGERSLDDISQADVDAFRASLLKGRSRKTVNNITTVLSSLLRYAATNKVRPPVDLSFTIKEDQAELVALSPERVDRLLVAAKDDRRYTAGILLAVDAGLRIGEVRGLERGDVDELRRVINVSRAIDPRDNVGPTKNRKRRAVPATPRLWAALAALGDWRVVLPVERGKRAGQPLGYYAMRDRLRDLYDAAGVPAPPKPWHCLRHTFCTELARAGVPMHVIAELAGHESLETTRRYTHATEDDRRQAIAALAGAFGQPVGNGRELKG